MNMTNILWMLEKMVVHHLVVVLIRKIKILNQTVKEVEKGNYTAKVKKLGNDEIGNVGKSFNKMTDALQKNISEIERVSENRKKFIGNLTHEIRTPLTSIVGYSSLIKNRKVTNTLTFLFFLCSLIIHRTNLFIVIFSSFLFW